MPIQRLKRVLAFLHSIQSHHTVLNPTVSIRTAPNSASCERLKDEPLPFVHTKDYVMGLVHCPNQWSLQPQPLGFKQLQDPLETIASLTHTKRLSLHGKRTQ